MPPIRPILAAAAIGLAMPVHAQTSAPATPTDAVAQAPATAWRDIRADELLVIELQSGKQAVIQLAPRFAPVHVANIQALARADYWAGSAIYRVQDNYVSQWGNNESEKPLPDAVVAAPPAEYVAPAAGAAVRPFRFADPYAPQVGHLDGWPVAVYPDGISLTHCYAMVGVGRGLTDTGMGGELYAVIGHGPRHLDRNIAIVGRVIEGMEHLSSLPRGTGPLGFYEDRKQDVPIARILLASQVEASARPAFQYMETASDSFASYVRLRANRKDDFFQRPAGGVDICNAPVPVRRKP